MGFDLTFPWVGKDNYICRQAKAGLLLCAADSRSETPSQLPFARARSETLLSSSIMRMAAPPSGALANFS